MHVSTARLGAGGGSAEAVGEGESQTAGPGDDRECNTVPEGLHTNDSRALPALLLPMRGAEL